MMVGVVVDLEIYGLGLVIVAIGKKLAVVLVGVVETVLACGYMAPSPEGVASPHDQFLSMKLATVNPEVNIDTDRLMFKD
nr:Myc-type, basic helix-loop-helix (bHLH) domain-containing protein [Tanacetum cinerariifolium]